MKQINVCAIRIMLSAVCAVGVCAAFEEALAIDLAPTRFSGSIDNRFAISVDLKATNNKVSGSYHYSTSKSSLTLDGTINGAAVVLNEKDAKGKTTGSFSGTLVSGKRIFGTWTNADKRKSMPFIIAVDTAYGALDGGKDGIIITQKTRKIAKPKRDGQTPEPAKVTIPVVDLRFLPPALGPKVQAVLSAKNVLKQSADEMESEIKNGDFWLEEVDYAVNYNKNFLVDADFFRNGCGAYPDGSTYHVLVDLKTGAQLNAKTAFNSSALPQLKNLLKARMEKEVQNAFKEFAKSPDELGALKDQLQGPFNPSDDLLNNFTVSDRGLTFSQDWGFPHVVQALQPDGKYFFSYTELKSIIYANGPLGQFVR